MPIHDWARVAAGTWHAFHLSWISELQLVLNSGLLPSDHYAQAEQIVGPFGPDVLTLQIAPPDEASEAGGSSQDAFDSASGVALDVAKPKTRFEFRAEVFRYAARNRQLTIRHNSDDRIVAIIELVSPGNKGKNQAVRDFVNKAVMVLEQGCHLMVIDLFPPTARDPNGLVSNIWSEWTGEQYVPPADEPLTLAAFVAGSEPVVHVEPTAVGRHLIEMPLFLRPDHFVNVPLEGTYQTAFRGVPRHWRVALESSM